MTKIEESILVKSLAQSVKNGKITIEQVPTPYREAVQEKLDEENS
jgi:hypothetical protein